MTQWWQKRPCLLCNRYYSEPVVFQTEVYYCRHNIILLSNIEGLYVTKCGLKKLFLILYGDCWEMNGRWQWCAAERRPGPRVLELPVFSELQLPPVLLQRLTLVCLMLHYASLPCQASITSKLFSAVYYTKVILEPGTRIPKTKLILCM